MQSRGPLSVLLVYVGTAAMALSIIALSLTAVVKASTGSSEASARDKTQLELQVESSREIRRALATPVSVPPLPPITARPARDLREIAAAQGKKPMRTKPSEEAMNAMAMDSSGTQSLSQDYAVRDRHSANW